MSLRVLAALGLFYCVQASILRKFKYEESIVQIKLKNKRACSGVQITNEWILVQGDCAAKGKLKSYKAELGDGQVVKIVKREEGSTKGMLALLQIKDSGSSITFPELDSGDLTEKDTFSIYSWDDSDGVVETGVDLSSDKVCIKKKVDKNYNNELHDCFTAYSKSLSVCEFEAGLPIFGKLNGNSVLYGFSTAEINLCDKSYKQASVVSPQLSWVNEFAGGDLKDCGKLPKVSNGKAKLDSKSSTEGSTATVKCDKGYTPSSSSITCQSSGKWETPEACENIDCGKLPKVSNGKAKLDSKSSTVGSTATVKCDKGYTPSSSSITCQSSGEWDTPEACEKDKDCGKLPKVSNGKAKLDSKSSTVGSTATVKCDKGYTPSSSSITCQSSGKWETPEACENIDCGKLPKVSNGKAKLDSKSSTEGSTATVKCDKGYTPSSSSITCQSSGEWDTPEACEIIDCGKLPKVSNGKAKLDSKSSTEGSTATVKCDKGYTPSSSSITCQSSGEWDTPEACEIIDCGKLPKVSNGKVKLDSKSSTEGSTATVKCDQGYESSSSSITCQSSGEWDTPEVCEIIDCGKLPKVSNGKAKLDSKSSTVGSTATVKCDKGYESSSSSITCQSSGEWDTPEVCELIDCGKLPKVSNGKAKLDSKTSTVGSTATVKCEKGYESSSSSITCQSSGEWDTPEACEIVDCGKLPKVTNGKAKLDSGSSTYESTATVTCNEGYTPSSSSISCQASGEWDTPTTCVLKDCGSSLPVVSNGNAALDSSTTTVGSTATVSCDAGYSPSTSLISCLASGVWETPTTCVIDCGSLPSVDNGNITLNGPLTTTIGSTATVYCNNGYLPSMSSISCLSSGAWDTPTTCVPDCGVLPSVVNGTVTLDNSTITATVRCNEGLSPSISSISCQPTGVWDTPTPCVMAKECGSTLPSVLNGNATLDSVSTSTGSTATIRCNGGFTPSMSSISCQSSGAWDTPIPCVKDCGALPSVANGTVTLDYNPFSDVLTAVVSCDGGFSASPSSISCQSSGEWETPACV